MSDPFLVQGPAIVSFSGGRTSAYMLKQIVDAHGGELPDDVYVIFANTGKERPETLRFVHECAVRWGVKIRWIEWRHGKPGFGEVGFNSAARDGEPFKDLIDRKKRLPNGHERWCTEYLKVRAMHAFMRAETGLEPGQYDELIGLRYDEGIRIFKGLAASERDGRKRVYPLSKAKVKKSDVLSFWLGNNSDPKNLTHPLPQDFDLGLYSWEGNCDFCFQKGKAKRKRIIRDNPKTPLWWARREQEQNGWFDKRDLVNDLIEQVRATPSFLDAPETLDDEEADVECGDSCAPDISLEAAE